MVSIISPPRDAQTTKTPDRPSSTCAHIPLQTTETTSKFCLSHTRAPPPERDKQRCAAKEPAHRNRASLVDGVTGTCPARSRSGVYQLAIFSLPAFPKHLCLHVREPNKCSGKLGSPSRRVKRRELLHSDCCSGVDFDVWASPHLTVIMLKIAVVR